MTPTPGSTDPEERRDPAGRRDPAARSDPAEEVEIRGTLFIMLVFLMALVGFWILMYLRLLEV